MNVFEVSSYLMFDESSFLKNNNFKLGSRMQTRLRMKKTRVEKIIIIQDGNNE